MAPLTRCLEFSARLDKMRLVGTRFGADDKAATLETTMMMIPKDREASGIASVQSLRGFRPSTQRTIRQVLAIVLLIRLDRQKVERLLPLPNRKRFPLHL